MPLKRTRSTGLNLRHTLTDGESDNGRRGQTRRSDSFYLQDTVGIFRGLLRLRRSSDLFLPQSCPYPVRRVRVRTLGGQEKTIDPGTRNSRRGGVGSSGDCSRRPGVPESLPLNWPFKFVTLFFVREPTFVSPTSRRCFRERYCTKNWICKSKFQKEKGI